jgi:hypothetical protein
VMPGRDPGRLAQVASAHRTTLVAAAGPFGPAAHYGSCPCQILTSSSHRRSSPSSRTVT